MSLLADENVDAHPSSLCLCKAGHRIWLCLWAWSQE